MFTRTFTMTAAAAALLLFAAPAGAVERSPEYGVPRALPSDYAAAGKGIGREYGIPRPMPSDYGSRTSPARHAEYGMPRTLPSDYGRLAASQGASRTVLDWSPLALGAASLLTALTLATLFVLFLRTVRRPPRPA